MGFTAPLASALPTVSAKPHRRVSTQPRTGATDVIRKRYLDTAVVMRDDRQDYGEDRFNACGLIDGDLFAPTFAVRGQNVRAISLRRAREKEVRQ